MRIGIDVRNMLNPKTNEGAGIGHHIYYLVRELLSIAPQHTFVLFFDHGYRDTVEFERSNSEIRCMPHRELRVPLVYAHVWVPMRIAFARLDLFHGPANALPLVLPVPSVLTMHDIAIYEHPEWFPEKQSFSTRVVVPRALRSARAVITVSEAAKRDIAKRFHLSNDKLTVIPNGATPATPIGTIAPHDLVINHHDLRDVRYVLYVGTVEPRKNIEALVAAFTELKQRRADWTNIHLVIAGADGWKYEGVHKAISASAAAKDIHHVGYVTDRQKNILLQRAAAFVWPSLYEGFGIPILEAFAAGVPVVTSNVSAMPEVAGDAAVLVDPHNTVALAEAMERVVHDEVLRTELIARGHAQAKQFTWRAAARATLALYERIGRGA